MPSNNPATDDDSEQNQQDTLTAFGATTPTDDSTAASSDTDIAWDDVDEQELQRLKLERCEADPVILWERTMGYGPEADSYIFDQIEEARREQVRNTKPTERIHRVTWPEVAAFCMAGSGDARLVMDARFVVTYEFAVRQVFENVGLDGDSLPSPLGSLTTPADLQQQVNHLSDTNAVSDDRIDTMRENIPDAGSAAPDADARTPPSGDPATEAPLSDPPPHTIDEYMDWLRRRIKATRDSYFVSAVYDELDIDTVPKAFWTRHPKVTADLTTESTTIAGRNLDGSRVTLDDDTDTDADDTTDSGDTTDEGDADPTASLSEFT